MTIHIAWWGFFLGAWLLGCTACIASDKSTGFLAGLEGAVMSLIWTLLVLFSAVIYLGFIR